VLVSEASTKFLFMRNLAKVRGKVCGELLDARPARRSALPPQTTFCNTIALKADMLQRIHQRRQLCWFLDAGKTKEPRAQLAGVQKAPRHEVAESWAPAKQQAL